MKQNAGFPAGVRNDGIRSENRGSKRFLPAHGSGRDILTALSKLRRESMLATKFEASGGCHGRAVEGALRRASGRNSAKAELICNGIKT